MEKVLYLNILFVSGFCIGFALLLYDDMVSLIYILLEWFFILFVLYLSVI